MQLNDVRAGNQVVLNLSGSTVTVLKVEDNKVLLDTFPNSSYCLDDNISGIPLTTSVLRKLSFTNDGDINTWFGEGININLKPDGFFYGLRITKARAKMQYLHQLQNYITDFYLLFKKQKRSLNVSAL